MANRRSRMSLRLAVVSVFWGFSQLLCQLSPASAAAAATANTGYDMQRHAIQTCEYMNIQYINLKYSQFTGLFEVLKYII
jgi:hypothetical protein